MASEPHPQVQAILDRLEANGVPPTYGLSVESARAAHQLFFGGQEAIDVGDTREFEFGGPAGPIPVRVYEPTTGERPYPVCVYYHGGGWVTGSRDSYDNVCTRLAEYAECLVVSVEYRLAPEHPFPAAPKDCYVALEQITAHAAALGGDADRVAVAGDSAGGNLSSAVALMARDRGGPDISHQGLLYPSVNPVSLQSFDSYTENAEGYFLELASIEWFYERYVPDLIDARNPYAFSLQARDLSGLPPATIVSAGFDPLRDEAFAYENRLTEAGISVTHEHFEEMIHGFCSMTDNVDAAEDGIEVIAAGLSDSFGN